MTTKAHPIAEKGPGRSNPKTVVVVGGGISGLSAAFKILEQSQRDGVPLNLKVLESEPRLGGVIHTRTFENCLIEAGPDSIVLQKKAALDLCHRLNLDQDVVYPHRSGRICILKDRTISPLPEGFKLVAPTRFWPTVRSPLFSLRGKARMVRDLFQGRGSGLADESLGSFVRRRLGDEVLDRVVQPMLASIFLADADRMSLNVVMPRLAALEGQFGSVIKGLRAQLKKVESPASSKATEQSFFTLRGGVAQLVKQLAKKFPPNTIHTGTGLQGLTYRQTDGSWLLEPRGMAPFQADAVVLACPFHVSSRLLSRQFPDLATQMASTQYVSCATLNLVYRRSDIRHNFSGNGFFVPKSENLSFLACNFVHIKYPERAPANKAVLRVFVGGALQASLLDWDDAELEAAVHRDLGRIFRINRKPMATFVKRYHRAMPQFEVGYGEKLTAIRNGLDRAPGLFLTGGGMGVVGIPDCIRLGQEVAEHAFDYLVGSPMPNLERTG